MQTFPHVNVLIVGAGLSGIGAAWHLQARRPGTTFAILEGRSRIGGTWDLFRYPGVRSDSDMFTLGYRFRPWKEAKAIADGPSIRAYVQETAEDFAIDKKIRFDCWVTEASWSSADARWTVTAMRHGQPVKATCDFLWMCSGYYRYAEGYTPDFAGVETFRGRIIHPQKWPEDLDYKGKKVVVIGSGATAVTLVPSMAGDAAQVTMLQRSPTYMYPMPATSALAKALGRVLPASAVYTIMRAQRIFLQQLMFRLARARPKATRRSLLKMARAKLPAGYDVETHFAPRYDPWDQRICLVPDDDLFAAIGSGKARVVTGEIDRFVETGIRLTSGEVVEADIIVTATGLILEALGGATIRVDGRVVNLGETFTYKGLMLSGVPNLASVFGYTNASWTLRADLVSEYVCRLLDHMEKHGWASVTPTPSNPDMPRKPYLDFSSGYVLRAVDKLPKQGDPPWRHAQSYVVDLVALRYATVADAELAFAPRPRSAVAARQDALVA